jgi:nucleoside-diphosphate-sugar epimerase
MKILALGGTGFIGRFVTQQLQERGHSMTVFHRGKTPAPAGADEITGERDQLADQRELFAKQNFDLVIDFVLSSERQARQLMATLSGITRRVVVLSSMDAYRAWGVFYGLEPGGLEPLPLTEESAVRAAPAYPPPVAKRSQELISWVNAEYDKVAVERAVLNDSGLPSTVLRLPMVYGPGDYIHRFHPYLKRMDDGRPFILFAEDVAAMRTPRGYVEDVAAGIVLAATLERASGRIYNICEAQAFSELEWVKKIAAVSGWRGELIALQRDQTPGHLVWPYNTAQHMVASSVRIRQELGYCEITPEAEAFERTIAWERANQAIETGLNYEAEDAAVRKLKASA